VAADAPVTEHTLRMALTVEENRRPARRLARQCAVGELHWHELHPANRRWAQLQRADLLQRWNEGMTIETQTAGHGPITLGPERDPQEVLRMGTMAGSCLSLGSWNSYSTVACALDANKCVVYARRVSDGKAIARQLLAISDAGKLLCFSPYPTDLSAEIRELLWVYDTVLSRYLQLPLHRAGEYEVSPLVAPQWYDDGLWSCVWRE
jgi:hypothetical protein